MKSNKVLAALIFIGLIISIRSGWSEVIEVLSELNFSTILLLIILQFITTVLISLQWQSLFEFSSLDTPDFSTILEINFAATFIESITPSSKLGGESAKVYLFNNLTNNKVSEVVAAVTIQKAATFIPFLIISLSLLTYWPYSYSEFISFNFNISGIYYLPIILIGIFILFKFLIRNSFIKNKLFSLKKFLIDIVKAIREILTFSRFLYLAIFALAFWLLYPVKTFILSNHLGFGIGFLPIVGATFLAYLVGTLPLTPGGLGSFEATFAIILSQQSITFAEGLTIAILLRLITFWFPLILSALVSIRLTSKLNLTSTNSRQEA